MCKGIPIHFPASNHTEAVPPAYSSRISDDHIDVRLICRAGYHLADLLPASLRPDMLNSVASLCAIPLAVIVSLTL